MTNSVKPGSVLVGVDDSSGSDLAVQWAAAYASAHQRPLTLLHGAGAPVVNEAGRDPEEVRRAALSVGRVTTDRARAVALAVSPSLSLSVHLEAQDPRPMLIDQAADAAVLVLGSRGHGGFLSLLLGSVSVALAAHAPCPVVVVRAADSAEASSPVVVGTTGDQDSDEALGFAFELADDESRPLEVVHATADPWLFPAPDFAGTQVEVANDWRQLLADAVASYTDKFPGVKVTTTVVPGSAAQALVVASEHASTVVVGARGRHALTTWMLGSVSRSVVESARCTVAVVRGAGT